MIHNNQIRSWKTIKSELKSHNGSHLINTIRDLEKQHIKTVIHISKIVFYKRCKKHNIIPKGMRIYLSTSEMKRKDLVKAANYLENKRLKTELNYSYAI